MRVLIVIPAYNEEASIGGVIREVQSLDAGYDIVVVNDGSTDGTREVASETGAKVVSLPINLGIGAAVQTGFKYAARKDYDVAVQLDGDGQHPPAALARLLSVLEQGHVDVAIGSRFITGEGFQSSFMRRIGIRYFMFLNRMLVGTRIADSTSGFRALNRKAIDIVSTYYPDEYPEAESIVLFATHGLRIAEVPVVMRERQGGVSSISALGSVYYMFKVSVADIFSFIRFRQRRMKWKASSR